MKPISEWGKSCGRGFVSDSRFGSGQVIKRTNRKTTRKWRREAGVPYNSDPETPKSPVEQDTGERLSEKP